jgi:hypothetical protein
MARPIKATVDYFPHVTEHGKTLFVLENIWGNDGYATWFKILERLGASENHVIDLNEEAEAAYLAAYCKIQKETLFAILDQCSVLNAINPGFWRKKLIYSLKFVENVSDAYRNRKEKLPSEEKIKIIYKQYFTSETELMTEETPQNEVSDVINRERERERESKGKNKKEKSKKKQIPIPLPDNFFISDRVRKWAAEKKRNHLEEHFESFKSKCLSKDYRYVDWDEAFMTAIRENWARIDAGGSNGNGSGNFRRGTGKAFRETQGGRSDEQPYPVDYVCTE